MSNEATTWAKWVNHALAQRYKHLDINNPYTGNTLFLLFVLAEYADPDWQCWPLQRTLSEDLGGVSVRTIRRGLKALKELGLVSETRTITETGARAGTVFQLRVEALYDLERENTTMGVPPRGKRLGRSRKAVIARADKMSGRTQNPVNESPDILSGRGDLSMGSSPDILSSRSEPTGQIRQVLPDIYDFSTSLPLKERARINHQINHQSSSEVVQKKIVDDDDDVDRQKYYRGVNVDQLFHDVAGLTVYRDHPNVVTAAIDVVLDRARSRVSQPTAYVRKSLLSDLAAVLDEAGAMVGLPWTAGGDVAEPELSQVSNSSAMAADVWGVPSLDELAEDAVPCTNMDHLQNYDMTATQLAYCNHCRIEQTQIGDEYPHVADATDAQVASLPTRLQQWAEQFRPDGTLPDSTKHTG